MSAASRREPNGSQHEPQTPTSLPVSSTNGRPASRHPSYGYQDPSVKAGVSDLERLERLKREILDGQNPFYQAIPQPAFLKSIYLGKYSQDRSTVPAHPEQLTSPVANDKSDSTKKGPNPSQDASNAPSSHVPPSGPTKREAHDSRYNPHVRPDNELRRYPTYPAQPISSGDHSTLVKAESDRQGFQTSKTFTDRGSFSSNDSRNIYPPRDHTQDYGSNDPHWNRPHGNTEERFVRRASTYAPDPRADYSRYVDPRGYDRDREREYDRSKRPDYYHEDPMRQPDTARNTEVKPASGPADNAGDRSREIPSADQKPLERQVGSYPGPVDDRYRNPSSHELNSSLAPNKLATRSSVDDRAVRAHSAVDDKNRPDVGRAAERGPVHAPKDDKPTQLAAPDRPIGSTPKPSTLHDDRTTSRPPSRQVPGDSLYSAGHDDRLIRPPEDRGKPEIRGPIGDRSENKPGTLDERHPPSDPRIIPSHDPRLPYTPRAESPRPPPPRPDLKEVPPHGPRRYPDDRRIIEPDARDSVPNRPTYRRDSTATAADRNRSFESPCWREREHYPPGRADQYPPAELERRYPPVGAEPREWLPDDERAQWQQRNRFVDRDADRDRYITTEPAKPTWEDDRRIIPGPGAPRTWDRDEAAAPQRRQADIYPPEDRVPRDYERSRYISHNFTPRDNNPPPPSRVRQRSPSPVQRRPAEQLRPIKRQRDDTFYEDDRRIPVDYPPHTATPPHPHGPGYYEPRSFPPPLPSWGENRESGYPPNRPNEVGVYDRRIPPSGPTRSPPPYIPAKR